MTRREMLRRTGAVCGVAWLVGCADGPPSLTFDVDECTFCRMTISDPRFGAAARSATGRAERFDAIECLAGWVEEQQDPPRSLWVTDAMVPGELVPLATVRFHRVTKGSTPMGGGYVAVASTRGATPWDGERVTWAGIRREVATRQASPAVGHSPAGH